MPAKKTVDEWFTEYGESHQHHANELIHWLCVPVIFGSVLTFIWSLPVPGAWIDSMPWFNWALVAIGLTTLFYLRLSPALSAGLLFFMTCCYMVIGLLDLFSPWPVWRIALVAFVVAWIGQFIGHRIEGRKPSFFKDIVFLLIGPAWLMGSLYKKIGQRY
ncbi:MAG: DUF962 domain-containing protein [Opitutaceae bacterium]|nr:DUF962 domain-containing protein [Opitutaceae bacterium]